MWIVGVRRRRSGTNDGVAAIFQRQSRRGAALRVHEIAGAFHAN